MPFQEAKHEPKMTVQNISLYEGLKECRVSRLYQNIVVVGSTIAKLYLLADRTSMTPFVTVTSAGITTWVIL